MSLLEAMKEEPIELCHFECLDCPDDDEMEMDIEKRYHLNFQAHCSECFSLTKDSRALVLAEKYSSQDISQLFQPWEELAQIYLDAGYPVYLSEDYFEVYKKNH